MSFFLFVDDFHKSRTSRMEIEKMFQCETCNNPPCVQILDFDGLQGGLQVMNEVDDRCYEAEYKIIAGRLYILMSMNGVVVFSWLVGT